MEMRRIVERRHQIDFGQAGRKQQQQWQMACIRGAADAEASPLNPVQSLAPVVIAGHFTDISACAAPLQKWCIVGRQHKVRPVQLSNIVRRLIKGC